MIIITQTNDKELIECMGNLYNPNHLYLFANINYRPEDPEDKDIIVGLLEIQPITKILGNIHVSISPEFQNGGWAMKVYQPYIDYIKVNTEYKKLMCTAPSNNIMLQRVLQKTKFKCCGAISKGIILKNDYQDLFIYELDLY